MFAFFAFLKDDFPESVGVVRVSEALQAHMWPVMNFKESRHAGRASQTRNGVDASQTDCHTPTEKHRTDDSSSDCTANSNEVQTDPRVDQIRESASVSSDVPTTSVSQNATCSGEQTASSSAPSQARMDSLLAASDMELLESGLGEDGGEDFETLFAKFAEMKSKPSSAHV